VTRVESVPFLRIDPSAVAADDWIDVATGNPVPSAGLAGWDPSVDIGLERHVRIDSRAGRESAGLVSAAKIVCAATWHCPTTTVRGSGSRTHVSDDAPELVLSVRAPGSELAGALDLRTTIALLDAGSDQGRLAAVIPGSVLWEDTCEISLEGGGSRFPMEWLDFESAGWLPSGAGWYLEWSPEEPWAPALGAIRLYINEAHTPVRAAVASRSPEPQQQVIRETMQFDIARSLILGALRADADGWDTAAEEPGSVASAVNRLMRVVFPTETLTSLRNRFAATPDRLEVRLQHGLRLFHGLQAWE
jgi:hypothetical protein